MTSHPVKQVIEAADRAIVAEDFDALMDFYADDAVLVVKPGLHATGKDQIRQAFVRIAEYFHHSLRLRQDKMVVLEGADTVLVLSETVIDFVGTDASHNSITRHSTYVFKRSAAGNWLCVIDNSYGTDLLKE